jgi:hypothetical protein
MNTKLTLNIDKDIIEKAKNYALESRRSLSSLVQNFFKFLISDSPTQNDIEISLAVKELSGVIKTDEDFDVKKEYGKYIVEKYS